MEQVQYKFWNIVVVVKEGRVLLLERQKGDFDGFVPPGGKVDFPESFEASARRELYEETGLVATSLRLVGMSSYAYEEKRWQHMYMDYICTDFEGELLLDGPEGRCGWFAIDELEHVPMLEDIKKRIQFVLQYDRYEYHVLWNEAEGKVASEQLIAHETTSFAK